MRCFYSGCDDSRLLQSLFLQNLERSKSRELREFSKSLLERKLQKKYGAPGAFSWLKNPLKRLQMSASDELVLDAYFERWSRVHTVYCHYSEQTNDVSAMVYHVIFDESGEYILSASVDRLIKIYSKDLNLLKTIRGHVREVSILALSSNNKYLVSVDEGGLVRVWSFPEGRYSRLTQACRGAHGARRPRNKHDVFPGGNRLRRGFAARSAVEELPDHRLGHRGHAHLRGKDPQ
jgi:WD40 repeat protein